MGFTAEFLEHASEPFASKTIPMLAGDYTL
jgi:hypothetical protein